MQCFAVTVSNDLAPKTPIQQRYVHREAAIRALENLETIYLVARKVNGGEYPEWVEPMKVASRGSNSKACMFYTKEQLEAK
jgi:hypothetical protein